MFFDGVAFSGALGRGRSSQRRAAPGVGQDPLLRDLIRGGKGGSKEDFEPLLKRT